MNEKLPTGEWSEGEKNIIDRFRENGPEDEEAKRLLLEWIDKEGETSDAEGQRSVRTDLQREMKRAKLYIASGLFEQAWDDLQNTLWQAESEQNEDVGDIRNEINELLDSIDPEKAG